MNKNNKDILFAPLLHAYERTSIVDRLPLKNPLSLMVDPSSACNFKCRFCPNGALGTGTNTRLRPRLLPLETFKQITEEIKRFEDPISVLRLYKDGEPLLNPDFIEFVRLAKSCGNIGRVETTTNGSRLSERLNEALIDSGLDRIVISLEGVNREQYMEFAGIDFDIDRFLDTLAHLFHIRGKCQVHIKTVKENLGPGDDIIFRETFGRLADRIFIENTVPSWPNFNVPGLDANRLAHVDAFDQPLVRKRVCPYLFYSLAVNADGSVSPCCVDWDRRLVLGQADQRPLLEIWKGKAMQRLRHDHLTGKRWEYPSCRTCGQIDYCTAENFDKDIDKILSSMQSEFGSV